MSSFTAGTPKIVRSVQRGTIVLANVATNTATINAVDIARSSVIYGGESTNDATAAGTVSLSRFFARLTLTNSTTVTLDAGATISGGVSLSVTFTVVEYYA